MREEAWPQGRVALGTNLVLGSCVFIAFAASNPPSFGILISRIMTSGFRHFAFAMASSPSTASPQTSQPTYWVRTERTP